MNILRQSQYQLPDGTENRELKWILRFVNKEPTLHVVNNKNECLEEGIKALEQHFKSNKTDSSEAQIKELNDFVKLARG